MAQAGTVWVDVRGDTSGLIRDIGTAAQGAGRTLSGALGAGAKTVLGDIASTAGVAAIGVVGIGAAAVKASTDFNKSMSGVSAVAGATAGQLDQLRDAALKAGADTSFSASEAATAEAELAKAGVSVADILGGALSGSLGLAAAGQIDLGRAAEISAQALNIFNLAGDQTTRVADVLASGANKSAADVQQLGDALQQGGLVAAQTGLSLEETVGVLSLFADSALTGSDAGTSFKTFLQRLVPQSEEAAQAMKDLGLQFFDANGAFVGIDEVAGQLQTSLAGLSDEQRQAALTTLFGSDAVRAASILMEGGKGAVDEYTSAVSDQGAASRMAAEQLNNLAGDVEAFNGSIETALINIGDLFDSTNRQVVQGGTELVNVFNDFATTPAWDAIQRNINELGSVGGDALKGLAGRLGDALNSIDPADVDRFFNRIESGFTTVANAAEGLEPVIAGVGTALSTMALRSIPFIGQLVPAISPITGLLGGLVLGSEKGRDALAQLGERAANFATGPGAGLLKSLSSLAGELSDGLVSALDDVGNAVFDAASALGPVLGQAIEELGPPLGDLIEAGGELVANVLPVLADLAGTVLPPAIDLLGGGLGIVADAVGILADNLYLLIPALAAFTAVKYGDQIMAIGTAFKGVAENALYLRDAVGQIAATQGVSKLEALRDISKETGSEVTSLASGLGGVNLALIGVTAAVTVGAAVYQTWANNIAEVRREGEALFEDLVKGADVQSRFAQQLNDAFDREGSRDAFEQTGLSIAAVSKIISENAGDIDDFRQKWNDAGKSLIIFRREGNEVPAAIEPIITTLFDLAESGVLTGEELNDVIDVFVDVDKNARDSAEGFAYQAEQLRKVIPEAELTSQVLNDLAIANDRSAGLEAQRNALGRLAAAFPDLAARAGIAVDDIAGSNSELANETERAVSALQDLSDELDRLAGAQLDAEEANRRANSSFFDLMKTLSENRGQFGVGSEGGIANDDAIARTVEQYKALAEAQALTDATGETSKRTLQELRAKFIELSAQGLLPAGADLNALLSKFRILDDAQVTAEVTAYTNDANDAIDALQKKFDDAKDDIEDPMETTIQTLIDQGKYAEANGLIDQLIAERTVQIKAEADAERLAQVQQQLDSLPGISEPERAEIQAELDAGNVAGVEALLKILTRRREVEIKVKTQLEDGVGVGVLSIPYQERLLNKNLNSDPRIGFASGGLISGLGGPTDDKVPVMGSNGEWVIKAASVEQLERAYGSNVMSSINEGVLPETAAGQAAQATADASVSVAMLSELQSLRAGMTSLAAAVSAARSIVINETASPRRTAEELLVKESRLMKTAVGR